MTRQTRHDVTKEVKITFLVCGFIRGMKSILFLANILILLALACGQWNSQKS